MNYEFQFRFNINNKITSYNSFSSSNSKFLTLRGNEHTHHIDVPGANLREVFHQVLPGQQALHVDVESLPHGNHLLLAGIQTEQGEKYKKHEIAGLTGNN